MYYKLMICN